MHNTNQFLMDFDLKSKMEKGKTNMKTVDRTVVGYGRYQNFFASLFSHTLNIFNGK